MSKITRKDYFKKKRDKVLQKLGFAFIVNEILDNEQYRIKRVEGSDPETMDIKVFKVGTSAPRLVHQFTETKDKVTDHTCKKNCPYLYAVALKFGWINLVNATLPLTKWKMIYDNNNRCISRFRWEFYQNKIYIRVKQKYGKISSQVS